MPFREKTAWVTLCAIVLASLLYFFHVPQLFRPHSGRWVLTALALSIAAFILIEVIAYIVLYLRDPRDARTPKDEREQLIDLKATRIASYVYVAGSFTAIFVTLHLVRSGPVAMAVSVMLAFVVAQLVKHTARIVYYRRDV